MVGPDSQTPIFREAVSSDSGTGEDHIRVGGPHLDRIYYLYEVYTVAFGKEAPFMEIGKYRGAIGVFHDLAGLTLNRPVEYCKELKINNLYTMATFGLIL